MTATQELTCKTIERLFPCAVKAVVAVVDDAASGCAGSSAVARRRSERRVARRCAREALHELGARPELRKGEASIHWPNGVVGSISHKSGLCVAVVAHRADARTIGVDLEDATPALSPATRRRLLGGRNDRPVSCMTYVGSQADWARVVFSAKEATYKAWYPLHKEFLESDEIDLEFTETEPQFEACVTRGGRYRFKGAYNVVGNFIASACWSYGVCGASQLASSYRVKQHGLRS
jgi:4'-phosphopantetheinyl transferase EntD